MGTPDFNFSFLAATEANYAQAILDLVRGLALGLDTTISNPPTGAIRWSAANARWEKYNGTTWAALCTLFDMNVLRLNGYQSTDFALAGHNHAGVYQPKDAELTAIAGLTSAADKAPYFTGSGAAALMTVTSVARTLLDASTQAAQCTALGLAIGSNVQAYSAVLAGLATAITETDELIYSTGSNVFDTCPFPAAARTLLAATTAALQRSALGLGSAATLTAGTAANNLLQLNASGQLPAVNGALLTGLAAAQISGLQTLPAGAVIFHASPTVPTGYLECNGAAVSRTTYAGLFAAIGTAHGYGDNSSTFNLPDLRGRFVRGWDHAIARDPDRATRTAAAAGGATGDAVGSVQADQYKSHTHTYPKPAAAADPITLIGVSSFCSTGTVFAACAASGGNETRPVNINLMACIKY